MKKIVFRDFVKKDPTEKANVLFLNFNKKIQNLLINPDNIFRELFDIGYKNYFNGNWLYSY
jgi:hypothetical protein